MKEDTKKTLNHVLRLFGQVSTLAVAMVFSIFAGVWFGYWLDKQVFHGKTHPWLTIIFFLFGLAGGIKNLVVLGKKMKWEEEKKKHE